MEVTLSQRVSPFVVLVGGGFIAASLFYHHLFDPKHLVDPNNPHWLTGLLFLIGVILVVTGKFKRDHRATPGSKAVLGADTLFAPGISRRQMVCIFLAICLSGVSWITAGDAEMMRLPWIPVVAWLAGITLVLIGGWEKGETTPRLDFWIVLAVLILGGTAFLVRGIDTTHIPHVLSGDEASSGLAAVEFIAGTTDNIFTTGWYSFPSLFYAIQSLPIRLLGQTIPALRLLAALAGALTVGAVYLVARAMFGDLTGLAAGIYMAAFHFHVNFSRIGMNNIWDGFWYVATLGLFWKAWHSGERKYFLWAGLSLGFSQYFYTSARLLPVIILVWLFFAGLLDRERIKRTWVDILLAYVAAGVVFLPLGINLLLNTGKLIAPVERVSIFGDWMRENVARSGLPPWRILLDQLWLGVGGFTFVNLRYWYNSGTPLLRPAAGTFFCLGLIFLALKPKDDRSILLVLWLVVFAVIASLSESTPASQRLVGVAGVVAIVVAYGATETLSLFGHLWPRIVKVFAILSLVMVALIGLDDLRFFFYEYIPNSTFGGDNTLIAQDLADYLKGRGSQWKVLFFGAPQMGYGSIKSLEYLLPQIQGVDMLEPWGSPSNPQPASDHLIFVFLPEHAADLEAVRQVYPDGEIREVQRRSPNVGLLYWTYELSPGTSQ